MLHAGETLLFHAWQLVPCSQQMSVGIEVSRKIAHMFMYQKSTSRGIRRMFLEEKKDPQRQPNAKDEKHHFAQLAGTVDEIHVQREKRSMLGISRRWR